MSQAHTHSERHNMVQAELFATRVEVQNTTVAVGASSNAAPSMNAPLVRGGLPPRVLRRIREFIDGNLEKHIGLDELASLAGLSKYHFARAFRQSVGVPPHTYLLKRRVDHARSLLPNTNMPLAEIALAAGFSNQSHLTCRFRKQIGMTPGTYRWNLC